jgi:hypothetical protein
MEPLGRDQEFDAAIGKRSGQARFRSEERLILHAEFVGALDLELAGDVDVTVTDHEVADDVAFRMDGLGGDRCFRIDERLH